VSIVAWIAGVVVVLAGFFVWANARTRRQHARFDLKDVEAALEEFVSPDSRNHDTWDLFLSWPIADPYLESVRQRCQSVTGHDADPTAREQVRAILSELRAHT
jgi:hypothetical protein